MYPIVQREGKKFIYQNSETLFPLYEDSREHVTAEAHYCYRSTGQVCTNRASPTSRRRHPATSGEPDANTTTLPHSDNTNRSSEQHRYGTYKPVPELRPRPSLRVSRCRFVTATADTTSRHRLPAGEGLGRGECPPAADIHNPRIDGINGIPTPPGRYKRYIASPTAHRRYIQSKLPPLTDGKSW